MVWDGERGGALLQGKGGDLPQAHNMRNAMACVRGSCAALVPLAYRANGFAVCMACIAWSPIGRKHAGRNTHEQHGHAASAHVTAGQRRAHLCARSSTKELQQLRVRPCLPAMQHSGRTSAGGSDACPATPGAPSAAQHTMHAPPWVHGSGIAAVCVLLVDHPVNE